MVVVVIVVVEAIPVVSILIYEIIAQWGAYISHD
jgi:hypothetical protein